jgi:hypothetical protein
MKYPSLIAIGLVIGGLVPPMAMAQRTEARGVRRMAFQSWPEALFIESRDTLPKPVVVPALGGRVMSYGLPGQNLLWVNPATDGRTFTAGGEGFQPGGFQCDLGPSVAGIAAHPEIWVGPYEWTAKKKYLVTLESPEDKTLRVRLEKEIQFDPSSGELGFVHRMKNLGERDSAYCFWHRIACQPGGFVLIPLNSKSRFPAGWSQRRQTGERVQYDGVQPDSSAVRLLDGVLVAKTGGAATAIGTDSDGQWVAYALGKSLFVVHFPIYSSATYSEGGNTVTVAWDEKMTELQPLSPEARLRSRKTYEFPLKWSVLELPNEVTSPEQARTLVEQIPGSPFL